MNQPRPRLWRWALTLLPSAFRERHGDELESTLEEHLADKGRVGRARVWLGATADVLRVAGRLRFGMRRERTSMFNGMGDDLRFVFRSLGKRPAFTAVAVITLAIGIGANTAIFSVVNGVLLRPLPYAHSDRLGILWEELGDGAQNLPALHPLDIRAYRERSKLFETFTLATGAELILGGADDAELVDVGIVEAGFFEFFGARPEHGRSILASDDVPGANPVVVLSHRLWERRFGSDPNVVGTTIELAGGRREVIGVLPQWFRLELPAEAFRLRDAELWTAARLDASKQPPRNYTTFTGFGRLRPDTTFAQAQGELDQLAGQLRSEFPELGRSNLKVRIAPLLDDVVKGARTDLYLLLGAVGFVLLIACANVANLLLVRGRARGRELSIRTALGAGRGGLIRLALLEGLVLAVAGGLLGVGFARGALAALTALASSSVPRLSAVHIDATVLAFVAALCSVCLMLFAALPALRASRPDPSGLLVSGDRSSGGPDSRRFRDGLVVFEVAASLVLLVGTGLMVRSFAALGQVDPGFSTEGGLTFRVALSGQKFPNFEARQAVWEAMSSKLAGLPGVTAVAATTKLPLTGSGPLQPFAYDEATAANWESVTADGVWVTPGYLETIGARVVSGRDLIDEDRGRPRIVIDDLLAERAFPGRDAVGQFLQINPNEAPEEERFAEVVGVVKHLRMHDLRRPYLHQIYRVMGGNLGFSVLVRASGDPTALAASARDVISRLAPGTPIEDVRTLEDLTRNALAPARLALTLMTLFGFTALLLACVGIYGVLSHLVTLQTRDIGVRMALGQSPGQALRQVVGTGMALVAAALIVGLLSAAGLSQLMASRLFGVEPWDPMTYFVVSIVLLGVSWIACWIPARRATTIDPSLALRAD